MPKIILIGGAGRTGKSTLAKQAAEQLHMPCISTDHLRDKLKTEATQETHPHLFASDEQLNGEQLWQWQVKLAETIWPEVLAFIQQLQPEESYIIEGTAILPHLVARDLSDRACIVPVFVLQDDADVLWKVGEERSQFWAKPKNIEEQQQKVEQVLFLNQKIREETETYGYPYIQQKSPEESLREFSALAACSNLRESIS